MSKSYRHAALVAALAGLAVVACATPQRPAEADLVPHQAIYRLELSDQSPTSQFSGLDGAAVSLIERTCVGWEVNEQVVMTMLTAVGGAIEREMNFKATETLAGDDYTFESRSLTNGTAEEFSGSARRKADGSAEAEFVTPRPFEMPLPDGTLFYVGLTQWLIDLARSGARTGQTVAFDGTDDEGPQRVTAFVLDDTGPRPGLRGDPALLAAKGWRFRLAFFALDTRTAEPEFEISLRLLENGIVTRFVLVFDDLVVDQILEDVLPAADAQDCG